MASAVGRVAVFQGKGQPFVRSDVPLPPPGEGELLVRIDLCTICGSDLHTIHGRRELAGPTVLGHEMLGRVVAVPPRGVADWRGIALQCGDRITWSLHASCGQCFYCREGLTPKCERIFKYGHEVTSSAYPSTGGFASHCQLRAGTVVVRVPEQLRDEVACPLNCATATVMAAFRQLASCRDRTVLILGAGMLGLTATAVAKEAGAAQVVVVDPQPARLERALDFGASHVAGGLVAAQAQVEQVTAGRGADVSLEVSGQHDAVLAAIHFLRVGGHAVLVGSVFPAESIALSPEMIVRRWLRISGVHNYAAEDLSAAVDFLSAAADCYPFASLVAACYELSDLETAIEHASTGEAVRIGIRTQLPE